MDMLRVDDIVVAVIADEGRGAIVIDLQLPDLEFFGGNSFLVTLADRYGVQKPIGPAFIGNEFSRHQ